MHAVPEHVTIGLPREGLSTFDDKTELAKHPAPYRIKEIEVQYTDEHIIGTVFKYADAKGHTIEGHDIEKFKPFGHLLGKVHKKHFKIDDDDEILEISGHAGARINELKFKTYRGKEESFGVKNGVHFVYSFPGHTFGAVSGGYEKHLDFIRIHVNELPPAKHHLKIIIIKS
ncbi:unnamed protein product (macronuclear) [Paramecium tetraurelia]|uniref:Jacalin-type lectin domain-containing protein n=1 Tax=Paramecium tetraurelia TaxID=5888 RepID=A0CVL1_PARTE|nr:uncharacterized protein GSPATT00010996001 [Paramecium tetraurelia]CAK74828.1 unnamed protein product [Paramecium tetraurelia]|eukprot:XP_001442225.1 hypothetical protein (macronuclear) [Paramecium tetraurelia strain d4-2]